MYLGREFTPALLTPSALAHVVVTVCCCCNLCRLASLRGGGGGRRREGNGKTGLGEVGAGARFLPPSVPPCPLAELRHSFSLPTRGGGGMGGKKAKLQWKKWGGGEKVSQKVASSCLRLERVQFNVTFLKGGGRKRNVLK